MVYLEYERYKKRFSDVQHIFECMLLEKEMIFTRTQPNAIRYDKDAVHSSINSNMLEQYVIELEETKIDAKLEPIRQILIDRHRLLMLKEQELRKSGNKYDKIYVNYFIDDLSIKDIAKALNYSISQVYRIIEKIRLKIK